MKAHLDAISSVLTPLGFPIFPTWATSPVPIQYFVLTFPLWRSSLELPIADTTSDLDTEIRLKAVASTTDGVVGMLGRARGVLSPGFGWMQLTVPLRAGAQIRWARSEFVDIDDSVTLPATNTHPAFGVDTYRLISQPPEG